LALAGEERQSLFVLAHRGATCVDFHCHLTLLFISGTPTYALKLRCVAKRLGSSNAGQLSLEINSIHAAIASAPVQLDNTLKKQDFPHVYRNLINPPFEKEDSHVRRRLSCTRSE
jgi:hypothetical protein